MQLAYKKYHSTETAWVSLHNDILSELDDNKVVLLVSLDVSAAFDTLDHSILLGLLENRLGTSGAMFELVSFLPCDHTARVTIDGKCSKLKYLHLGVPQGICLRPKTF